MAHPKAPCIHAGSGSMEDDGVQQWQAVRQLGSGLLTVASFDYKNPAAAARDQPFPEPPGRCAGP